MQSLVSWTPDGLLAVAVGETCAGQGAAPVPLLSLQLAPGWRAAPDGGEPQHQIYHDRDGSARLALSYAGAWAHREPPSDRQLVDMARACGMGFEGARALTTDRGGCRMGRFGTATFGSPAAPFAQAWYLTDGRDMARAVYVAGAAPTIADVTAAHRMVLSLLVHWSDRAARLSAAATCCWLLAESLTARPRERP